MEFEDYLEPEIAVTAAIAAAIFSPRVRHFIRKGLVYGTAGVLMANDALTSFTRSVSRSFQQAGTTVEEQPVSQSTETAEGLGGD